ncbi:MAG: transcription antitermination factor NusB [Candidatus Pacebacteria bacterium]|nr:transcription antitermination factor NusB [Candidatus Paceibacterota bacterium]
MANRHLSRSIALQSLFEWDFCGLEDSAIEEIFTRNANEFAPGMGDFSFMKSLVDNIIKKRPELDTIIEKAAPEWPLDKIAVADRNILRIGLYELLFADKKEVPAKVAINEAIELAKTFGGETSGKFVNGVLGAVYKEMGEPGKDEVSTKKKFRKDIPYEEMPIEVLGGAVVYARDGEMIYLALVHDVFGHWTLSKGRLEVGEDVKTGTMREIKEEIGLDIVLQDELAKNEYIATHPEKGKLRKQVTYFLGEAKYVELKLESSGGLDDAKWFNLQEILDLNFYNDILPIVTKAINILLAKKPAK